MNLLFQVKCYTIKTDIVYYQTVTKIKLHTRIYKLVNCSRGRPEGSLFPLLHQGIGTTLFPRLLHLPSICTL